MRHSSTASRLSHKMACSLAVTYNLDVQAWDISTAFLQGLQFNELRKKAQELGHEINVPREVFLKPPGNVWRHLQALSPKEFTPNKQSFIPPILQLLKPAYGLVDAPLLWQMSLLTFIKDTLHGYLSKFDENFVVWTEGHKVQLCMVIHVDDIFVVGKPDWIQWAEQLIESRFGLN